MRSPDESLTGRNANDVLVLKIELLIFGGFNIRAYLVIVVVEVGED
jgi:hypothetical protein